MEHSPRHTVIFTTLMCVFFSLLVSAVAVALKDRQVENQRLDNIKNVLTVAGLLEPGQKMSREELNQTFEERIRAQVVDMQTGGFVEGVDALAYDPRKAAKDDDGSQGSLL